MASEHIKEHIDRCIEVYGSSIDVDFKADVERNLHEAMRADLMLAIGMLMALTNGSKQ